MTGPDIRHELWLSNATLAAQLYAEHLAALQPIPLNLKVPEAVRHENDPRYWELERVDAKEVLPDGTVRPITLSNRPAPGEAESPRPKPQSSPQSSHIPITPTDSDNPRRWMPSE